MDKSKLTGLILISLIMVMYSYFEGQKQKAISSSTENTITHASPDTFIDDSVSQASTLHAVAGGVFATASAEMVEKLIVLENEDIRVTLSSKGAQIQEVMLKKYQDHLGNPFKILTKESSNMGFQFTSQKSIIHTSSLYFQVVDNQAHPSGDQLQAVTFILSVGKDQYIRQTFTLPESGYGLTQSWEFVGSDGYMDQEPIQFTWHNDLQRAEKDAVACRNKTTINYYLGNNNFENLKEHTDKKEECEVTSIMQWVAFKQRFFTTGIVPEQPFLEGKLCLYPTSKPDTVTKEATVSLQLGAIKNAASGSFKFYFGPNTYKDLKGFAPGFSKNLSLGWPIIKWLNQYAVIPVFAFIENHVSNYGIIILLMVILIKLALLPLSYRSYVSMAEIKLLKPTLDKLKERYGSNMQQMQMEQVKLYKEMGINPLSGCIPVLLQMPVLLAMFNFFPNAIELRQKSFLWATDLSTYDSIINLSFHIPFYGSHVSLFTLLMTASTMLYTWYNNQMNPPQGPMKTMSYLFPVTFMFILNSFPAGLSFYYFVSNIITIAQQAIIKRFVDEDKIKEKLNQNRNNTFKKDKSFKQRLQKAMQVNVAKK